MFNGMLLYGVENITWQLTVNATAIISFGPMTPKAFAAEMSRTPSCAKRNSRSVDCLIMDVLTWLANARACLTKSLSRCAVVSGRSPARDSLLAAVEVQIKLWGSRVVWRQRVKGSMGGSTQAFSG